MSETNKEQVLLSLNPLQKASKYFLKWFCDALASKMKTSEFYRSRIVCGDCGWEVRDSNYAYWLIVALHDEDAPQSWRFPSPLSDDLEREPYLCASCRHQHIMHDTYDCLLFLHWEVELANMIVDYLTLPHPQRKLKQYALASVKMHKEVFAKHYT